VAHDSLSVTAENKAACGLRIGAHMRNSSHGKSRRKTAFVPRLAYGCVGVGMGVIPLCVSCSAGDSTPSVGVEPYLGSGSEPGGGSGSASGGAGSGDAPSIGIRPAFGLGSESGGGSGSESGGESGSASGGADASFDTDAPTIGIEPAYILDAGIDANVPDANGDGGSSIPTDAPGD
jgi:hypothetical protein